MSRVALISLLVLLTPLPAVAGKHTHLVLPGESLSRIARRYHTSPQKIRKLNRLKTDDLREGQKLKVQSPVPAARRVRIRYRVRKGESFATVARRHKISSALLRRLNPRAGARLQPGQALWVVKEIAPGGSGRSLYQLESGVGFEILEPRRAFGTMLTVSRVAEVLSEHGIRTLGQAPVLVGDLSREQGGALAPHRSHRRGRDVDIRYPLVRPTKHYVPATLDTLDLKRTWSLIRAFIRTGDVIYVFVDYKLQRALYQYAESQGLSQERLRELFQYPRSPRAMTGIIRHEPGHRTHFHLRFKPEPDSDGPNS